MQAFFIIEFSVLYKISNSSKFIYICLFFKGGNSQGTARELQFNVNTLAKVKLLKLYVKSPCYDYDVHHFLVHISYFALFCPQVLSVFYPYVRTGPCNFCSLRTCFKFDFFLNKLTNNSTLSFRLMYV